jgi:hypothetical protein
MGARAKNRENSSLLAKWCPLSTPLKADLSTCGILRFDERANFKGLFCAVRNRSGLELWTASLPRGLTGRSKGENAFSKPDPVNLNPKS